MVEEKPKIILLMGETGAGKSTLVNQLVPGGRQLEVGHGLYSKTTKLHSKEGKLFGTDQKVLIFDSCGFGDNRQDDIGIIRNFVDLLKVASQGIHLVFFCSEEKTRISDSELTSIKEMKVLFGNSFPGRFHFVVTKMDRFNDTEVNLIKNKYEADLPELFKEHRVEDFFTFPILYCGKTSIEVVSQKIEKFTEDSFSIKSLEKIESVFQALNHPTIATANYTIADRKQKLLKEKRKELLNAVSLTQSIKYQKQKEIESIEESYTIHRILFKGGKKEGELSTPVEILSFCGENNPQIEFYQELKEAFLSKDFKNKTTLSFLLKTLMTRETKEEPRPLLRQNFEKVLKAILDKNLSDKVYETAQNLLKQHFPNENLEDVNVKCSTDRHFEWWDYAAVALGGGSGGLSGASLGELMFLSLGRRMLFASTGIGAALGMVAFGLIQSIAYTQEGVIESSIAAVIDEISKSKEVGDFLRVIMMFYYHAKQKQGEEKKQ